MAVPSIHFSTAIYLLLAACAFGFGYAAWNIGILHGNITLLATASYFTPIISSLIAMMLLDIHLSLSFWQGTVMVTIGSFVCWFASKAR